LWMCHSDNSAFAHQIILMTVPDIYSIKIPVEAPNQIRNHIRFQRRKVRTYVGHHRFGHCRYCLLFKR
jgi:hypothetical protein